MRYKEHKTARNNDNVILPNGFQLAFYNLIPKQMEYVKDKLMTELKWKNTTFYNRMRGRFAFSPQEIKTVEEVFREVGIDAWTGAKCFKSDTN